MSEASYVITLYDVIYRSHFVEITSRSVLSSDVKQSLRLKDVEKQSSPRYCNDT